MFSKDIAASSPDIDEYKGVDSFSSSEAAQYVYRKFYKHDLSREKEEMWIWLLDRTQLSLVL